MFRDQARDHISPGLVESFDKVGLVALTVFTAGSIGQAHPVDFSSKSGNRSR